MKAREPFSPCSSPPQCPTRMVRFGRGYTCFRIRIASSIVTVPVPLSVAPEEPSHESKWAESMTYSSGFSVPGMTAIVLNTGTSPRARASDASRITGPWLRAASRQRSP